MLTFNATLHFPEPGYVAEPYWPEMERVINITKESGMNRARSQANRRKALEEYLNSHGMTLADFEELERLSRRPFHTDDAGQIIIPADKISAFLVNVASEIRAASKPCNPDQVRSRIVCSDFATGKTEPDGVWERFAVVSGGSGNKLSNQRGLRRSHYITEFSARGTFTIDPDFVNPETLQNAVRWGGLFVGIGACRKMGRGRFALESWRQQAAAVAAE